MNYLLTNEYTGKSGAASIEVAACFERERASYITRAEAKALLPKRVRNSHKGSYGRAAIVAGSVEYTGAAYLSAAACLHAGAGYTALYLPADLLPYYFLKVPEVLLRSSNEGSRYAFNEEKMKELLLYDAVAYGMGMGKSEEVYRGLVWLLSHYEGKLIIDADGLNSLAAYGGELPALLRGAKCEVLCTPHVKEFSRLSKRSTEEVLAGGVSLAEGFARASRCTLLLKNALSTVTDGERTKINATGNSGQAKGGTGDVLSGVLAGLCAQGLSAYDSARLGSYLVGKAAELGAREVGEYSLTASTLIAYLGKAFLFVAENADKDGGEE